MSICIVYIISYTCYCQNNSCAPSKDFIRWWHRVSHGSAVETSLLWLQNAQAVQCGNARWKWNLIIYFILFRTFKSIFMSPIIISSNKNDMKMELNDQMTMSSIWGVNVIFSWKGETMLDIQSEMTSVLYIVFFLFFKR